MGVDIFGWVEIGLPWDEGWVAVVDVGILLDRNYDAFGCLFGVKNSANFVPIAAERGIPADASQRVYEHIAKYGDEAVGATWVAWSELRAVDWTEWAAYPDSCVHRYERDESGALVFKTKAAWDDRFAQHVFPGQVAESMRDEPQIYQDGQEWEIDGAVYRAETLRREEAIGEDWRMLFRMMEALADRFGADNVRLVVWFSW